MKITLRVVLAILAAGIAVEGFVSLFLYLGGGFTVGIAGLILGLGPILALAGLLILWVGRRQWNLVSGGGVQSADIAFGLSLVALVGVLGLIGWFAYTHAATLPPVGMWAFGWAVWGSLFFSFATFALIAYDLAGVVGKISVLGSLTWAAVISAWLSLVLAGEIGPILRAVEFHTLNVVPLATPVIPLEGYVAPVYLLILVAYLDAMRRVPSRSMRPRPAPRPRPVA
jgi:hypothetical protein